METPVAPSSGAAHHTPSLPHATPDVPRALLLPGQVLGAASSATATLIESGGRCVRDTWRAFVVALFQGTSSTGE